MLFLRISEEMRLVGLFAFLSFKFYGFEPHTAISNIHIDISIKWSVLAQADQGWRLRAETTQRWDQEKNLGAFLLYAANRLEPNILMLNQNIPKKSLIGFKNHKT